MKKIKIRKIKTEDFQLIKELWELHFGKRGAEKRTISFNLLINDNPLSVLKDGYYVMEEDDKIIAYEGIMPHKMFLAGNDYDGYIYHDTMVDPAHRGRGLGTKLVKAVISKNPLFSIAVWMNAPNARVFEKCGWKPVTGLTTYVRGYNAEPYIKTKSKTVNKLLTTIINSILSSAYKIEKMFYNYPDKRLNLQTVNRFDGAVDKLFHAVKNKFGCITYRTKDVLNWKYANKYSSAEYKKIICKVEGELLGYIVYRTRVVDGGKKLTTVFDYLCSPERIDVFRALLEGAIVEIEKETSDSIEIMCSNKMLTPALKRLGFLGAGKNQYALKYINENMIIKSTFINMADKWHFTHGDGDRLFWEI